MPVCPYGDHRLRLAADGMCQRCGNDLALYGAIDDLAISCYNESRRLWDEDNCASAGAWVRLALALNESLPQANWLMAAILAREGSYDVAREKLERARCLGANVDPAWVLAAEESDREFEKSAKLIFRRPEFSVILETEFAFSDLCTIRGKVHDDRDWYLDDKCLVQLIYSNGNRSALSGLKEWRFVISDVHLVPGPNSFVLNVLDIDAWRSDPLLSYPFEISYIPLDPNLVG